MLRILHALRWFTDEAFRRRIGRQLNRGEATDDLRRFIFLANRGAVRYPHHDDQTTQAHLPHPRRERLRPVHHRLPPGRHRRPAGRRPSGQRRAIAHLSPAHFETINPYGTLTFDITGVLNRSRRPLRRLKSNAY